MAIEIVDVSIKMVDLSIAIFNYQRETWPGMRVEVIEPTKTGIDMMNDK